MLCGGRQGLRLCGGLRGKRIRARRGAGRSWRRETPGWFTRWRACRFGPAYVRAGGPHEGLFGLRVYRDDRYRPVARGNYQQLQELSIVILRLQIVE